MPYYYEGYSLSSGEIYEIQESVYSKKYQISPMRVISRSLKDKDFFCELEGQIIRLPNVNKDHFIHIRFPISFLLEELPLVYLGPLLVSPFFKRYTDKNENYIKFKHSDIVVISAFIIVLIKSLMKKPSFLGKSCYNHYSHDSASMNFSDSIGQWKDVRNLIYLDCMNEKERFSKSRLIVKLAPLVNSEQYLMNLISSIVNIPILDKKGRDISSKTGAPMIPLLDDILFNIYLDDIDQKISDSIPKLKYDRIQHEICIPLETSTHRSQEEFLTQTLDQILLESHFDTSTKKIYSTGETFMRNNSYYTINDGRILSNPSYPIVDNE